MNESLKEFQEGLEGVGGTRYNLHEEKRRQRDSNMKVVPSRHNMNRPKKDWRRGGDERPLERTPVTVGLP